MEASGQLYIPAALTPGKEHPGTHSIVWFGTRGGLDNVK
jgi:hypothetical protein